MIIQNHVLRGYSSVEGHLPSMCYLTCILFRMEIVISTFTKKRLPGVEVFVGAAVSSCIFAKFILL